MFGIAGCRHHFGIHRAYRHPRARTNIRTPASFCSGEYHHCRPVRHRRTIGEPQDYVQDLQT